MRITSLHNPDRYMADLRQVLSHGRKRIGILIGAGAPMSMRVDETTGRAVAEGGRPLVPGVAGLTEAVVHALVATDREIIETLEAEIADGLVNIETILTQVRKLAQAIGNSKVHGRDGRAYDELGRKICKAIGNVVSSSLPESIDNPYSRLVSWISGTQREYSVEIFTPNYDLLMEEAFERSRVAYFDGFTGSHRPFFDPASVSSDELPSRWSRLWKLHGSLGWKVLGNTVIRTGQREATELIYPDHLKYDQVTRLPYSALFERLRQFLTTPDTLFICSGFSFLDRHICAVLDEALAANAHTAILAFQFRLLERRGGSNATCVLASQYECLCAGCGDNQWCCRALATRTLPKRGMGRNPPNFLARCSAWPAGGVLIGRFCKTRSISGFDASRTDCNGYSRG